MRIAKPICSFAARARAQSLKSPQRAWPRCLYRSRMRLTIIRRATRLFYPNAAQVQQSELSPSFLADWIRAHPRARLLEMATQARALAMPGAAERVAEICV